MKQLIFLLYGLSMTAAVQAQQLATAPDTSARPAPVPAAPVTAVPDAPAVLECTTLVGRVTDAFDYPLTGATVMLRTRDKAFTVDAYSTNAEGKYLITSRKPIPRDVILQINAAGYTSVEQPLTNCKPLDISLTLLPGTKFKSNGRIKKTATAGKVR